MNSTQREEKPEEPHSARATPVVSAVLADGRLVESLYRPESGSTALAVWDGERIGITHELTLPNGERLVPYRGDNPLFTNRVVLFPSEATEFGDAAALVGEIAAYVHKYVDLTPTFERLAAEYVLFTWVYDRFQELPYLRLHGEYGSGKTRFLQVVGAICRTPIFAGGASTVSPLFHLLDRFGGTLILDEADFRFSDERAQLVKILNNGNVRGFPVLRSESVNGREYRPVAYQVYGPKIVAMRGEFDDRALESRFISERSDGRALRSDIPLNLPNAQAEEALGLRNKLLMYRFRRFAEVGSWFEPVDRALEPRINQVFSPLLANIEDQSARELLRSYARGKSGLLAEERSASIEAELLAVLRHLNDEAATIALSEIADLYSRAFAANATQLVTPRYVGGVLRKRLGLRPQKSNGVYVISPLDRGKLSFLFDRYRITEDDAARVAGFDTTRALELTFSPVVSPHGDFGDIGDVRTL
ncbi:MAG: hypothetical protein DCF16_13005 [Alphaproteobacteria bacterium]|nr:MAG: hypothetical protein DCF16_13005 [Alphaproteobacteria bacterium]